MAKQKQIEIPAGFKTMDPKDIKTHPHNIKKHPKEQIEAIVQAIILLGVWKDPLGLTKDGTCYFGNGRLLAALKLQEMGLLQKVPYVPIDHLSKKERNALMILDNKIADMASYDRDNMTFILQEAGDFSFESYSLNLEEYNPTQGEQDEIPDPRPSTTIKTGDMFQLGNHFILCGDSTIEADVLRVLQGKRPDQIVTDPPYGVKYSEKNDYLNEIDAGHRIQVPIENDDIVDYKAFTESWLKLIPLADYNTVYIFQSSTFYLKTVQAIVAIGFTWGADLIWKKQKFVFGRKDYKWQHEPVLYCWKGRHKFYGPNNRSTILEYERPLVSDLHPTTKPIPLLTQLIQDGSKKGALVFDAFLGSGSTLIAAEETSRVYYGIEKDPIYCQVIIDRFEKKTGVKAKKI